MPCFTRVFFPGRRERQPGVGATRLKLVELDTTRGKVRSIRLNGCRAIRPRDLAAQLQANHVAVFLRAPRLKRLERAPKKWLNLALYCTIATIVRGFADLSRVDQIVVGARRPCNHFFATLFLTSSSPGRSWQVVSPSTTHLKAACAGDASSIDAANNGSRRFQTIMCFPL